MIDEELAKDRQRGLPPMRGESLIENVALMKLLPINRTEQNVQFPLSLAQSSMWLLSQIEGVSTAYHNFCGYHLSGILDHVALRRALDRIVARHEALRTNFETVDGQPVQRIADSETSHFCLIEHDLRERSDIQEELSRLIEVEIGASFKLESGPLIRGRLIKLADDQHAFVITVHHIVFDGWSMGVLAKELSTLYEVFLRGGEDPLPKLSIQYADYALCQREWIEGEILQRQSVYWKSALAGIPPLLALPLDHPRPAKQSFAGDFKEFVLDKELTAALKVLSKRHGTTLFMTLLTAWAVLLSRLSGQHDVVIGTPTANRRRTEIESLIGFFVSTLALRIDLSDSPTVSQLLDRVKECVVDAQQHQDIPFEKIVELLQPARSTAHSPIFQVMFAWQNAPLGSFNLSGIELKPMELAPRAVAKFDLTLSLREVGDTIAGGLEYATSLFEAATIERHLCYFRRVLEAMTADESQLVECLSLLGAVERSRVLYEWNDTRIVYPSDRCIHELFEKQVEKTPAAKAITFGDASLSYEELNRRANRLAHYLRDLAFKPDARVAICIERSLEMVIAVLAVLKAGGAYVPLDTTYPPERLRFMIEDSTPIALLTQKHLQSRFAESFTSIPVLDLNDPDALWHSKSPSNIAPATIGLNSSHLAYVIYTSGSTGHPKGVMIEHRGMVNFLESMRRELGITEEDVLLAVTTLTFDIAGLELFLPLNNGARIELLDSDASRDGLRLRHYLKNGVTVMQGTPATWRILLEAGWESSTRLKVLCGGEALSTELARKLVIRADSAWNLYGPTETTIWSTIEKLKRNDEPISIGRPIANTQVYILDHHRKPVPIGVTGELYIGGAGVARGYLNRPELTAEKFLADPFSDEIGARVYRTGDLCRWLADGSIEFLGRNDFQVKTRGFRIELGEIESHLSEHSGICEAVVIAREGASEDKQLVAYYTTPTTDKKEEDAVSAVELRSYLLASLPDYMVPHAYVRVERMPLTPNGKLDLMALPVPDAASCATLDYEAPQGAMEVELAAIWAEVLKLDRVGRHDNFFTLGGHSLLAMQVISRIRQRLSVNVSLRGFFESGTIAMLAPLLGITVDLLRTGKSSEFPLSSEEGWI